MIPPRYRIFLAVVPLLALGWLVMALVIPGGGSPGYVALGYLFGTLFGHTTLASAWTAFGPLKWQWRLPLSVVWLAILWIALAINLEVHGGPDDAIFLFALCLLGQWVLVQLPLWGIAVGYGVQLRHKSDAGGTARERQLQFGIRQLMVLTTIVAVVLGSARAFILLAAAHLPNGFGGERVIFIFLFGAAVIMTLPLLLAALLPRWSLPAVVAVLVLIGVATTWELPLLNLIPKASGPDAWHFALINAFTAGWVLAVAALMRIGGYHLAGARITE